MEYWAPSNVRSVQEHQYSCHCRPHTWALVSTTRYHRSDADSAINAVSVLSNAVSVLYPCCRMVYAGCLTTLVTGWTERGSSSQTRINNTAEEETITKKAAAARQWETEEAAITCQCAIDLYVTSSFFLLNVFCLSLAWNSFSSSVGAHSLNSCH